MQAKNSFLFIHGFLGCDLDWNKTLKTTLGNTESIRLNLFSRDSDRSPSSFDFDALAKWVCTQGKELTTPRILVGYSLGGRIALHALKEDPDLWAGAVFISTHPGLTRAEEQENRLAADEIWAKKFETSPWAPLMAEWNSQSVFKNGRATEPLRHEKDFSRTRLTQALRKCSLGRQDDFRDFLSRCKIPVSFVTGQYDTKFVEIANSLPRKTRHITIPGSGHRVLFDQPEALAVNL